MEYKVCKKCEARLPATKDYYYAQKNGKYGLRTKCKSCQRVEMAKYRSTEKYKKAHRERAAKWRKDNPEKAKEITRDFYAKNADRINTKRKEKYHNDPVFKSKIKELEKRYKESGRRYEVSSTPEQREKARIRSAMRRLNPEKKAQDYKRMAIWRVENKEVINKNDKKRREELLPSYIASSMRVSVKDLTPEIIETKQNIIKLKRHLKSNGIKIQ